MDNVSCVILELRSVEGILDSWTNRRGKLKCYSWGFNCPMRIEALVSAEHCSINRKPC